MNQRFAFDLDRCGAALSGTGDEGAESRLAGADEAGRGCLAGPLIAAAVCFDYERWTPADFLALADLDDSKRLSGTARERLYRETVLRARRVVIVARSSAAIDDRGLHLCNLEALGEAVEGVCDESYPALVDGFALPGCRVAHEAVIGGDGRSAVIAAASVVAKVTRDRVMRRMHQRYPGYGFDRHVGYATAYHQEMITLHGVCPLHRLSFDAVSYRQLGLGLEE